MENVHSRALVILLCLKGEPDDRLENSHVGTRLEDSPEVAYMFAVIIKASRSEAAKQVGTACSNYETEKSIRREYTPLTSASSRRFSPASIVGMRNAT